MNCRLPAELWFDCRLREAEPPRQCVPRQEPGNERVRGGDQRGVSIFTRFEQLILAN